MANLPAQAPTPVEPGTFRPRVEDLAVLNVLNQADRSLTEVKVWRRVPVTAELDLVVAMASPETWPFDGDSEIDSIWWGATRQLGLLLQNRTQPGQLFMLAIEQGPPECFARILRATVTDTVISCQGEKSERYPHQKFVYDVRAKALISRISYEPFQMYRARVKRGSPTSVTIVGRADKRDVIIDFIPDRLPEFRILAATSEQQFVINLPPIQSVGDTSGALRFGPSGAFRIVDGLIMETRGDRQITYPLPSTIYEEFQKARPERAKDVDREFLADGEIGPSQLEGNRLWFGTTFYDGEGNSGIGRFGYFDTIEKKYQLFNSPAVAETSVSAIHVEPNAVWLARVGHGEGGDGNGGGVVRFDRRSETFQAFRTVDIGREFAPVGDRMLLATDGGISVFQGNQVKEYIVDRTTDGRLRIAAVDPKPK